MTPRWPGWADTASFYILLMIVAMRPLLTETYSSSAHAIAEAAQVPDVTTSATTAWFDLAIWSAGLLAALAAWKRGLCWRWTGVEVGGLLMLAGAVVSTCLASNHRMALNGSADWISALVLVAVVANQCRDRLRVALLLAVLGASGITSAARCGMQAAYEFDETVAFYQAEKEAFWGRQGIPLDDPRVELYERRMRSREASGFFPFSNGQGAWLSVAGFAGLALVGLKARVRPLQGLLWGLALVPLAAIGLTGSVGALVATGAGLLLWGLLGIVHERGRRHWRLAALGTLLAGIVGLAGIIIYGGLRGGLPGDSLNFRWQYGLVTRQILAEHGFAGVGALNFDRHYLLYKPIEYPEEIRDPHNLFLSAWSQWGLAGLLGLVAALIGGGYTLARSWGRHTPEDEPAAIERHLAQQAAKRWLLGLGAGFLLLRFWIYQELWWAGEADRAVVWFDLGFYGLLWVAVLAVLLWVGNEGHTAEVDYLRIPLIAGVVAFLLQELISSGLLFPGTLTPFAAVAGVLLARTQPRRQGRREARRTAAAWIGSAGGLIALLVLVVVPVSRCTTLIARAATRDSEPAVAALEQAARADRWDPAPLEQQAYRLAELSVPGALERAYAAMLRAVRRDPLEGVYQQTLARLAAAQHRLTGDAGWADRAVEHARRYQAMYPTSPERRLFTADLLLELNQAGPDAHAAIAEAARLYEEALSLNDARPGRDEARRWSPARRDSIRRQLDSLRARMTDSGPTP